MWHILTPFNMAKHSESAGDAKSTRLVEQKIQQIILSNTNGLDLLTQLAEYLRDVFGADVCLLYAQHQEHGIVVTEENCSLHPRSNLSPLLEQPQLRERKVEVVEIKNLEGSKMLPPLQTVVSLLSIGTQREGLILLGSKQRDKIWTKGQRDLLRAVATPLAIAFHQSQTQQQLEINYPYQKLINQITQAIRDHQEINQILKQAITATGITLKATAGLILLLKYRDPIWKKADANSQGMIQATTAAQWAMPDYQQQLFPSESVFWVSTSPLCCQALQLAPQPLIINENHVLAMFPLMGAAGKSLSARVLGFVVLEYSPPRQLLAGELELISSVSNQISYALIQDQTLRQVKAIVDERTAQLQVSLEVQGRLYEKIRHQVDQLRQLNQIKDEFISAISHELRTPLTSMTLAIRMLQEEELTPERRAKYLEVLAQQCQQEILLINDLLALQQLEENSPLINLEMINIKPILQQLGLTFQQHWTTKGLELQLEIIPETVVISTITTGDDIATQRQSNITAPHDGNIGTQRQGDIAAQRQGDRKEIIDWKSPSLLPEMYISTHADSLQRILAELLTNAGKYSHPDTTVVLRVEQTMREISFSISNLGDGIPPAEQELIFEKFHRAQTAVQKAIPGTGLGLALVKPLVSHLRGKITVASGPSTQLNNQLSNKSPSHESQRWITCFTVKLPQFLDGGKV